MPLTLALTEAQAEQIGNDSLMQLIEGYDEAFPDLHLMADIVLIGTNEMRKLNLEQRQIDEATDVLSFPTMSNQETLQEDARKRPVLLGSIVICPHKVEAYGETLIQVIHHGLLHLLGYDHDADFAAWMSEEKRILEIFERHNLYIPPVPYESV